jgi:arylsulfatase A-like enzyme
MVYFIAIHGIYGVIVGLLLSPLFIGLAFILQRYQWFEKITNSTILGIRNALVVILLFIIVIPSVYFLFPTDFRLSETSSVKQDRADILNGNCLKARNYYKGYNFLLITIDTLRWDHLSCYGYERKTSPIMDNLASEGIIFDKVIVQRPKTTPSFASIMTGLYPWEMGIWGTGQSLPEDYNTIAERLREKGYTTAGITTNANLSPSFGFSQGFSYYVNPKRATADTITDLTLEWIDNESLEDPYFLWVHYVDPHTPYTPPTPYDSAFIDDLNTSNDLTVPLIDPNRQTGGIRNQEWLMGPDKNRNLTYLISQYDGEILFTDSEIGRLLRGMTERGLMNKTLLLLTSDHGESLGEHKYFFEHGYFPYEPCSHIPMIFKFPDDRIEQPRRIDAIVQGIDIVPTILELLGIDSSDNISGKSMLPILSGEIAEINHHAFIEADYSRRLGFSRTIRSKDWVFIYHPNRSIKRPVTPLSILYSWYDLLWLAFEDELYYLPDDPYQEINLIQQRRDQYLKHLALLVEYDPWANGAQPMIQDYESLDKDHYEALKALGYIH